MSNKTLFGLPTNVEQNSLVDNINYNIDVRLGGVYSSNIGYSMLLCPNKHIRPKLLSLITTKMFGTHE